MASCRNKPICLSLLCLCVISLLPRATFGQTTTIPGGLTPEETPQIIILAFQGRLQPGTSNAVGDVYDTSNEVIKNPNGCPITGTFFVGDTDTDYTYVKQWHTYGLEIAMYSKTIKETNEYWRTITSSEMDNEVAGMKKLLKEHGITAYGYRNPSFYSAGDAQFTSLVKNDIMYDSTLQIMRRAHTSQGYWPTKMTEVWGHKCQSSICPANIYPQLWEVPIVTLVTSEGAAVSTAEASGLTQTADSVFNVLWNNYLGYKSGNKAPFVINLTPSWLMGATGPVRIQGLRDFLKKVSTEDNAYIISMKQMLDWVRAPTPIKDIDTFAPWDCDASRKNQGSTHKHTSDCAAVDEKYADLDKFLYKSKNVVWVAVDYTKLSRNDRIRLFFAQELQDNYEPPVSSAFQFSTKTSLYTLVLIVMYALL